MASITISNLRFSGADLFLDSESFLIELKDTDSIMGNINGASISFFTPVLLDNNPSEELRA